MSKWLVPLAFLSTTSLAAEWRLVKPREVFVDIYKYDGELHDPYLEPIDEDIRHGGTFNIDMDLVKYKGYGLYWDNQLFFDQSEATGKVRHGGWRYELGLTVYANQKGRAKVELFRQHESRHIFEDTRQQHFPVYDRFGIRVRVYP
jgi:hypothetical protein